MVRSKLILSIAAMSCLLLSNRVHSQGPDGHSDGLASRLELAESEIAVKMRELEYRMTEHAMEEAKLEFEKAKLRLAVAQKEGDSDELGHIRLEVQQAAIRIEMHKIESEMARLRIELAKVRLQHMRAPLNKKPGKLGRV